MKLLPIILIVFCLGQVFGSIFPEDEESWHRRIDAKIDKNRKSNVVIRMKIDPSKFGKSTLLQFFVVLKYTQPSLFAAESFYKRAVGHRYLEYK